MLGYDSLELPRKTVRSVIRSEFLFSPFLSLHNTLGAKVPAAIHIHPDAFTALSRACVVFTNYIAAAAQEHSKSKTHQSVGVVEVERALKSVGFEQLMPESYKCIGKATKGVKTKHRSPAGAFSGDADELQVDNKGGSPCIPGECSAPINAEAADPDTTTSESS